MDENLEVGCFSIDDECLDDFEIVEKINAEMKKLDLCSKDVISIMQPSGYSITRVFYRKRMEKIQ